MTISHLEHNDLHEPHDITVMLAGADVVATIRAIRFDGLTRQRIIVATEQATGGQARIEEDQGGEPVVIVTDQDDDEIARGVLVVERVEKEGQ